MKKIVKIILGLVTFLLLGYANPIEAQAAESIIYGPSQEYLEELKQTFPEYAQHIDYLETNTGVEMTKRATMSNLLSEPTSGELKPVFYDKRKFDEETEYSLVIFEDGTYASVQALGSASWSGGSSSSGSGYTNYNNRRLTVYFYVLRYPMLIHDISYSLVNNGYDSFMSGGHGYAFVNNVGKAAYPTKRYENSSGPAYSYFNATNYRLDNVQPNEFQMQVKLEVGSNTTKVFVNGTRVY